MARYSPIAPIDLLEEMHSLGILGSYLLLLTHDVLLYSNRYQNLIRKVRMEHKDATFIIMDNSVVELGEAALTSDVIHAAKCVTADCIMTPDCIAGFKATKELIRDQKEELLKSGYPLMRVPQGISTPELVECITWLRTELPADKGSPEYWGIPRWITNTLGSRVSLVQFINQTSALPKIHMLGMSKDYADDIRCTTLPDVIGIDSANPLVLGFAGYLMSGEKGNAARNQGMHIHLERGGYWHQEVLHVAAALNVEHMHRVVGRY